MRSACAICDRPVDLEAAPAKHDEVICETCRNEVLAASGASAPKPAAAPAPAPAPAKAAAPPEPSPVAPEAAPASRRKVGKAAFWIGDDEVGARAKPAPAAASAPKAASNAERHDSSIDDLKLLAGGPEVRAPRHVDDLMGLGSDYFGSRSAPLLQPPDLRNAPDDRPAGDARIAPTVDLVSALKAPKPAGGPLLEVPPAQPEPGPARAIVGIGVGVLVGVLVTVGIGQFLRSSGAPAAPTVTAAASPPPVRTAEPAPPAAVEEPKVKAVTPGAKAAADEPAPVAKDAPAADATGAPKAATPGAGTAIAATPGAASPGASPGSGSAPAGGAKEPNGGAKEAKAGGDAKEAPEPAPEPAKPSAAEALMAAQNAALSAPRASAFNRGAAATALASAAGQAAGCKKEGDPAGIAKVSVTFAPSGRVTNSQVVGGPYIGSAAGGCIARAFRSAQVPAFEGEPVTVQKAVDLR